MTVPDDFLDRTFLRVTDPGTLTLAIVNVMSGSWREEAVEKMGTTRRAFAGNLLSTERTPKRAFSCTVEFLTAQEYDSFLALISDPLAGIGIPQVMSINGGPVSGLRGQSVVCRIWPGSVTVSEEARGPGGQLFSTYQVPLTMREV